MQWFRFYSEALDDPKVQRLTGDLFKVWVNLLCLANEAEERGTLPELDDIAFRLRLDSQKTEDALLGLKRAGLLDVDQTTDLYVIHAWGKRQPISDLDSTATERKRRQRERDAGLQRQNQSVTRDVTRDSSPGHAGVTGHVTRLEKSREEEKRVEQSRPTPLPPAPRRPDPSPPGGGGKVRAVPKPSTLNTDQQSRFDRWYPTYPNRQHRPEAERAFRKVDPDDALTDRLIADTAARQQGRKWSDGFIEHPATYLNNRVWEDDIEPVRTGPPRASPNGQQSNEQAKFTRSIAALQGVGGHRGPADIPEEHGEAGRRALGRSHP